MSDIFMSRESIFFMVSDFISSIFLSVVVSSSNCNASVFPPTLLLTLIFSIHILKDIVLLGFYIFLFLFEDNTLVESCCNLQIIYLQKEFHTALEFYTDDLVSL